MDTQPTKQVSPSPSDGRTSAYKIHNGRYVEIHDADERRMRDFIAQKGYMQDFHVVRH